MSRKLLEKWYAWFALLSKDCGVLRLNGREMRIVGLSKDEYEVQDVFGRNPAFGVKKNSADLSDIQLRRSLQTS